MTARALSPTLRTHASRRPRTAPRGFTLIEVVAVIVIVVVLAVIGYPAYNDHLRKARRADVQAALYELAQHMERYHSLQGTYLGAGLPFTEVPRVGETKYYDLDFPAAPTDTAYTLRARPKGIMADDPCGNFYLFHTGRRSQGNAENNPVDLDCWRG